MSEFNFDNMKNVDIPESFVDGALNVPPENKPPIPFIKHAKIIAFAASIVLVCTISVALFFITNGNPTLPPIKYDETECNISAHEKENTVDNTDDDTHNHKKPSKSGTKNSQVESESSPQTEEETKKPTQQKENPTEKLEEKPTTKPEKPKPTESTEKPTEPLSTEDPIQDGPPERPENKLSYIESFTSGKITAKIHNDDLTDAVYCRIYDSGGNILGDSNLYSYSKRAGIVVESEDIAGENSDLNTVEYNTDKLGTNLSTGNYYVVFYDNVGVDICSGYINIS